MTGEIVITNGGAGEASGKGGGRFHWWFLPSWMGLDAPCVVLTWTWAVSRCSGLVLALRPAAGMFLVVWCIYLMDRLIDVARCGDWSRATGRLRFGKRFRPVFVACLAAACCGIVGLFMAGLPGRVVVRATMVAAGVGLYFVLCVVPVILREKIPGKEFGVGLFFALGAFACLGATARSVSLLISVGLLVAYNCLIIAARDAGSDRVNDPGAASRWWRSMARDLCWAGAALMVAWGSAAIFLSVERPFFIATATAAALLATLHRSSRRFSGDAVRALADFALFTPLAVFGVWAR